MRSGLRTRRQLLRGGLALASMGLLTGCGVPVPGWRPRLEAARIGVLTPSGIGAMPHGRAFLEGLRGHGWVQGGNLTVDYRFAQAPEAVTVAVADLLALKPDVIVAEGAHILKTLKATTDAVPIVMAFSNDPVATGLVASLARPGGNLTGTASLSTELTAKRFDLLTQILPQTTLVACCWSQYIVGDAFDPRAIRAVGAQLGVRVQLYPIRAFPEMTDVFEAAVTSGADALVMLSDLFGSGFAELFGQLVVQKRLPTMAGDNDLARAGSLLTYGPSFPDLMRRAAAYVDKILRGARPADLPVEQPTAFDFVINLKTAGALRLTIPQSVLQQATEVIQ